ncbi:MAG: hypothetical protein JW722_01460 [Demequinaceae bacterium]|nr:hypothetical protein [Demequinaceae bacterium]
MGNGYMDSTPPQVARVVGGWTLGIGLAFFVLTYQELGRVHPPSGAIIALVLLGAGGLSLIMGSRRLATADAANRRFFASTAGTEILATRRRLQYRLERVRWWLLLVFVAFCAWWVLLAGTLSCTDGVCNGFAPGHEFQIDVFRWICLSVGFVTLTVATLARIHGNETDRWEDLASDYLRRRDDGPVPGLKHSRWE